MMEWASSGRTVLLETGMHARYFPPCPVDGPLDPVPFGHFGSGAVPAKCRACKHLFEGECLRAMDTVGGYLQLDHGSCGINGPTDPVPYEDKYLRSKVEVPRKCSRCPNLAIDQIRGFHCRKDAKIWGDFPRGLDWGTWQPDFIHLQLPMPKVTTRRLAQCAFAGDLTAFVIEHRRINPGLSLSEARADFAHFRSVIDGRSGQSEPLS